jgi:hypothetical protein
MDRLFGAVDYVQSHGSPWSTCFIKSWPSALGSTAWIKLNEMVRALLIWSVDRQTNGWPASPSVKTMRAKQSLRERYGRWLEGAQA